MTSPSTTREALLDAAETLFAERGYAAVGIREISAEAQANIASISYHFGSKRDLYLATVRRAMEQSGDSWGELEQAPASRPAAVRQLVRFLRGFLARLVESRELSSCGRLMLREAVSPSEALDAVIEHFVRPQQEMLQRAVSVIAPRLTPGDVKNCVRSVLAQLLHYLIFPAFLARQEGEDVFRPERLLEIADHVARFSLKGLGVNEAQIRAALADVAPDPLNSAPRRDSR